MGGDKSAEYKIPVESLVPNFIYTFLRYLSVHTRSTSITEVSFCKWTFVTPSRHYLLYQQ